MASDIPTRSTLKQYKAAFVSLTILAIVSVLYISSSEDLVGSSRLLKKTRYSKQGGSAIKSRKKVIKRSAMKSFLGQMIKEDRTNPKIKDFVQFPKKSYYETLRTTGLSAKLAKDHLIWLMSYPFGGAEETISLVEKHTGTSMATNYGDEMFTADGTKHLKKYTPRKIQNWVKETHRGPFQNNAELTMAIGNVFVRTHCSGFCLYEPHIECTEKMYMTSMTTDESWQDMCSWGKNAGKMIGKRYGQGLVNDMVVVLRDPKEIVQARFENFVAMYGKYTYDVAGFLAYCKQVDNEHKSYQQFVDIRDGTKTSSFFDNDATVPCYTELTRIGMWSSRAITASRTRRNSLVVRYADLANPRSQNLAANGILEFAGLEKADPRTRFAFDRTAPSVLGTDLLDLMQKFITTSYPENTKTYFIDPVELVWTKISGFSATQLAVSGDGQTIWAVYKYNPRSNPDTFYRTEGKKGNWIRNNMMFDFVAIDGSGNQFWVIKRDGDRYIVFQKIFGDTFVSNYEGLVKLAVDSQGNVYGIGEDRKCYYHPQGERGIFRQIEAPNALNTIVVSDNGLHVWATTLQDEIYYKPGPEGDWIKVDGSMKYLSVTSDGGIIIGTDNLNKIYYRKGVDGSWVPIVPSYQQAASATISGDGRYIWTTQDQDSAFKGNVFVANSEIILG